MLTLDVMREIELSEDPLLLRVLGSVARANFNFPPTRTDVAVEGAEHLSHDRRVMFAMNHTDRYNYIPLYVWQQERDWPTTCTWVKGKYYQHPMLREFLAQANQIPVPSRGYLITADADALLGEPPSSATYRILRDAVDRGEGDRQELLERASRAGVSGEVEQIVDTPRDLMGLPFDPKRESYVQAQLRVFGEMMEEFVNLNLQAFRVGCNVLVFPEGTRSPRLTEGHTGLAEMAIRMKMPVVPIACQGSDRAYPGENPFSRGGTVEYRFGEPLEPEGALAEFQTDDPFRPFTRRAEQRHGERFRAMTDLIMDRIEELLDPEYSRDESVEMGGGTERFV